MIVLPRDHFSWYQLNLWETDKERYRQEYFLGGKKFKPNQGMEKGKQMADSLASDELCGDPVLDIVMARLPKFEIRDVSFQVELKIDDQIIKLWIQPDSCKADFTELIEYKTSQTRWTKKDVDKLGQITFYETGIWILKKIIPKYKLVDIETEKIYPDNKYRPLRATGKFHIIETKREFSDIVKMLTRIKKAVREISEEYQKQLF